MEYALLVVFLSLPSFTILACRPRLWIPAFIFCSLPPFAMLFIFVLKVLSILHELIV